jgi:hypothetical protein
MSCEHDKIDCIKSAFNACVDAGAKLQHQIVELRELGKSGLTLHDPVSNDEIVVLEGVNEVLLQLMHETKSIYTNTKYDPTSKTITLPVKLTLFGQSNFSDTSLWGGAQSRKVDHNEAGAEAPYEKNKQTLRNKRTFNVGPVPDYSGATHNNPTDTLSLKIMSGLSDLSGLKEKLVSCCVVNARIDRYVLEQKEADAAKKDIVLSQSTAKFNGIMQKIRMGKTGPKTLAQFNDPGMRNQTIENLLSMEGSNIAYVVPYREFVAKGIAEPVLTWKVETSLILGSERKHRTNFDALKLNTLWKKVASTRLWHLKAPLNFQHGQQIDPDTAELAKYDKFTAAWVEFACSHGILPHHYKDIQLLDSSGALARINVPGKGTRSPNYFEYSVMSQSSMMQGSVMLIQCAANARDGCYYNPTHVQVITPANYLYKLDNSETAPRLVMPFDDLFGLMRRVLGVDKDRTDLCIREAEADMNNDYGMEKPDEVNEDVVEESSPKRQKHEPDEEVY